MLTLQSISKRFGDAVALDDVSFSAAPGHVVGFVGPNGAGKTTAMRIVLGVLRPDRGVVLWRDRPIDARARRRFGYMPEERGLYPKMRVRHHLVYLARLHGLSAEDARVSTDRSIEVLGLSERADDRVQELSLGNQQRVQLAAAMVHRPEAFVLDEPFSGLDPVGVDALSGVLREEASAGAPVVFSSHQLDLVERLCDEVVLIDHGRILAAGGLDEVRGTGERPLVRVEVEGAHGEWWSSLDGVAVVDRPAGGVVLALDDGASDDEVLAAATEAGRVKHFGVERRSLSQVFREAVRR